MPITRTLVLAAVTALAATPEADSQSGGAPPAPHFSAERPAAAVLMEQNMQAFGIFYPDMPMGVVARLMATFLYSAPVSVSGDSVRGEILYRSGLINLPERWITWRPPKRMGDGRLRR
jgi:hypothetical protein